MNFPDKPPLEEVLKHHGIKGMKWGVRKEDDSSGSSPLTGQAAVDHNNRIKEYIAAVRKRPKPTAEQANKNLAKAHEDFANKFSGSGGGGPKKGLSPGQKKALLAAGVGVGLVGLALVGQHELNKTTGMDLTISKSQLSNVNKYMMEMAESKGRVWGSGTHLTEKAILREGMTLPDGHMFHRISAQAEHDFGSFTYATHSLEDYNRYLVGFSGEVSSSMEGLHHITFHSKGPIRIPANHTVLDTLGETMRQMYPEQEHTSASVLNQYEKLSGTWAAKDLRENLFENLRKKGYGGLYDEMDAGIIGDSPLIIFAKNVTEKVASPITKADISAGAELITPILNRK